jgi:hypothetical protein
MPHFHRHHHEAPRAADTGPDLPMPSETSTELRFLDPAVVHFRRKATRFEFREDGEAGWREVSLVRLFPLREPDRWVSVIDTDGREIGIIKQIAALSRDDIARVREEFHQSYLIPQIRRILACRRRGDAVEWTVGTNRGRQKFLTRGHREQIRDPSPSRLSLIDIEGNRYDIPSIDTLDPESRRRLETQL